MKKKVLLIGNHSGGMYGFRKELIEKLKDMGNEIIILTPFDDMINELVTLGVRVIDTPMERRGLNPIKDIKLIYQYYSFLKREKPDIAITYTIKPNIYGGFLCGMLKIPFCANITGLGSVFQKKGILREMVTLLYKVSLKKAKVVFFENKGNRNLFVRKKIVSKTKTCVLRGAGVNLRQYEMTEYPPDEKIIRFLFMGRIMKEKGIEELFKAVRRLYQEKFPCSLTVLGEYEEDYEKLIQKYEAEGWLQYCGYQSDVRPFIRECHCFVLPSWHEGMANTNLESAAMGRPVITSNIFGCKEAVSEGVNGYLCRRQDENDLYKALKKFIGLPYEKRVQMGAESRKRMEKLFDKEKVVKKTVEKIFGGEV